MHAFIEKFLLRKDERAAIMFIDVIWPGDFAEHLTDISTLLTPTEMNAVAPSMRSAIEVNGVRVMEPWFVDTGFLFYRKDLLAKYGFTNPPATWDELEEQSRVIQAGERPTNPMFWSYVFPGR